MNTVDLGSFDNSWYKPGSILKRALWYLINVLIFKSSLPYPNIKKRFLLKCFGAKIGRATIIKPNVNIKYPWFVEIGDNSWIGEGAWIDSLGKVKIGNNVCISQGAKIMTGSHNYKSSKFDLLIKEVTIEDGVWLGAFSIVSPGVTCGKHSVLAIGSVATHSLEPYKIYEGNPALYKRDRTIA